MFEYHGNNLTVDADGVSVTVELTEPLDIEKPLADLDLNRAQVVAAEQRIVNACEIPSAVEKALVELEPEERYWWAKHFLNGYSPTEDVNADTFGGDGNEEVLARAIPFLGIGFKGLLAFCAQESESLTQLIPQLEERGRELVEEIALKTPRQ